MPKPKQNNTQREQKGAKAQTMSKETYRSGLVPKKPSPKKTAKQSCMPVGAPARSHKAKRADPTRASGMARPDHR